MKRWTFKEADLVSTDSSSILQGNKQSTKGKSQGEGLSREVKRGVDISEQEEEGKIENEWPTIKGREEDQRENLLSKGFSFQKVEKERRAKGLPPLKRGLPSKRGKEKDQKIASYSE